MRATLRPTEPMTPFRPRAWAKPIISVAASGLGAAVAGPLAGALGGWIGDALGGSTSKLLENFSEKFGEKAEEKLLDVGGDSLADATHIRPTLGRDRRRSPAQTSLTPDSRVGICSVCSSSNFDEQRRTMRFALFLLHEGSSGMRLALEIPILLIR